MNVHCVEISYVTIWLPYVLYLEMSGVNGVRFTTLYLLFWCFMVNYSYIYFISVYLYVYNTFEFTKK